jgi:hypothetical protein
VIRRVIEISRSVTYDELPSDIVRCLRKSDIQAINGKAKYFKLAAQRSGEPSLIELFRVLDDTDRPGVTIVKDDDEPWIAWFEFLFPFRRTTPELRPPARTTIPDWFPSRVASFYAAFGGLRDFDQGRSGMLPPEQFVSYDDLTEESRTASTVLENVIFFFAFGNGDFLGCSDSGEGVCFNHEGATLDAIEIDRFLDMYFAGLLVSQFD